MVLKWKERNGEIEQPLIFNTLKNKVELYDLVLIFSSPLIHLSSVLWTRIIYVIQTLYSFVPVGTCRWLVLHRGAVRGTSVFSSRLWQSAAWAVSKQTGNNDSSPRDCQDSHTPNLWVWFSVQTQNKCYVILCLISSPKANSPHPKDLYTIKYMKMKTIYIYSWVNCKIIKQVPKGLLEYIRKTAGKLLQQAEGISF